MLDFLDAAPRVEYVVAMAENAVLTRCAEPAMVEPRRASETSGQTEHVYTEVRYAARTWAQERRVVIKAEVVRLEGRDAAGQSSVPHHESAPAAPLHL